MVKLNLKNKFAFLNKSKAINSINSTLRLEENINTSATWFQSMEPVIYAKKNGNKLYKFKKICDKFPNAQIMLYQQENSTRLNNLLI